MKTTIIIPARYGSTRFPGKALAELNGKPMIRHVYERAQKANGIDDIIVATDSEMIVEAVIGFGGKAVMTSPDHKSGTDRIAEVARGLDADIVINLQGDEPRIDPKAIEEVIAPFSDDSVIMSTLAKAISDEDERKDHNVVKVAVDRNGFALYFSRSVIPFRRNDTDVPVLKHIGIYAYRREFLLELSEMEQTPLEKTESLEQLRVLENGYKIKIIRTDYESIGVDTPSDMDRLKRSID